MPLGIWKSKWEIHREDMARHREESERRSAEHYEEMNRHRDDMDRHRQEAERRDAKHQERMECISEEMREDRAAANERWLQLGEETSELRVKFDRELAETRRFNRQMLTQLEKTYFNVGTTLGLVGEQMGLVSEQVGLVSEQMELVGEKLDLMGERIESNTEEVKAQTKAIMQLLDYFKGSNGGPPV